MTRWGKLLVVLVAVLCGVQAAQAQTGKIAGTVTDEQGEPLPGVNVVIDGTTQGTSTDEDGYYSLLVRPDTYVLVFKYIGFDPVRVKDVGVRLNKTTPLDVEMTEGVMEGEEITVTADRPVVQKDRTTTTSTVTSEQLETLPVTTINEAINLQAGVVDGHFRGGRSEEVSYLVNGVPINNAFSGGAAFEVDQSAVENLEVITGVFNAEYGQAMSGVVNVVTKDIPQEWTASYRGYVGAVADTRKLSFVERTAPPGPALSIDDFEMRHIPYYEVAKFPSLIDQKLSFGGPIWSDKLGIRLSGRYLKDVGYRYARRLFVPSDQSFGPRSSDPPEDWLIGSTGDQEFVPLDGNERYSFNANVTVQPVSNIKLDYNLFVQSNSFKGYQHNFKYNPDGINGGNNLTQTHVLNMRYVVGDNSFFTVSYSYLRDAYDSDLYDSPTDERFVASDLGAAPGSYAFALGGNNLYDIENLTETHTVQADFTSQLNRVHLMKAGVQGRFHHLDNRYLSILVEEGQDPRPSPDQDDNNALDVQPMELSAYVQDKMEFENLIVNAGVRFDYFDPDYLVPSDLTAVTEGTGGEDGQQQIYDLSEQGVETETDYQISPRLGIAFPISATGVLRFSAGLFFQTPTFDLLYQNPEYDTASENANTFGNANLDPERTLTFEIGLQQGLTQSLGVEATVYSKDIRNLTGQRIRRTQQGNFAVPLINTDVGTVRGVTLSVFQRPVGPVSWTLDYTLQFAEGTSSSPSESFARQQSGLEQISTLVRLNWDRRHVVNNTVTYRPRRDFSITLINRLRTGTPYTTIRQDVRSIVPNDDVKPFTFTSDVRLLYRPTFIPYVQLFAQVTNLTNAQTENQVYADTGLATESVDAEVYRRTGLGVRGINSIDDYVYQPQFLGAPREASLGLRVEL